MSQYILRAAPAIITAKMFSLHKFNAGKYHIYTHYRVFICMSTLVKVTNVNLNNTKTCLKYLISAVLKSSTNANTFSRIF